MGEEKKKGLFARLREGLSKTRGNMTEKVDTLVRESRKIDDDFYDELEEILILSDCGVQATGVILDELRRRVKDQGMKDASEAREALKQIMVEQMDIPRPPLKWPMVMLVVGVNGVGKTTTIGKLAHYFKQQGKKVVLGAADTFRAAAVDQLTIWAERAGVEIVKQQMGSDPAAVAYDTVKSAVAKGADVVLIDTAGRLHNRVDLMNELTKIRNSVRKVVPDAPHDVMMILDASTGQNAFAQAKEFSRATDVTSITVTKLDGTAKGGVVVGVSDQFGIPVKFIGVGEGMEDIKAFDKENFVETLFEPEEIHK